MASSKTEIMGSSMLKYWRKFRRFLFYVVFFVYPIAALSQDGFQWNRLLSQVSPFEEVALSRGICSWGTLAEFDAGSEQWAACGRVLITSCNIEYGECLIEQTFYYNNPDEPPRYIVQQQGQWFEHLRRVNEYQPLEEFRDCFLNKDTQQAHCFRFMPS